MLYGSPRSYTVIGLWLGYLSEHCMLFCLSGRPVSPLIIDDPLPSSTPTSCGRQSTHHTPSSHQHRSQFAACSSEQRHSASAGNSGSGGNSNADSKKGQKPRAMFPKEVTAILREWLMANLQVLRENCGNCCNHIDLLRSISIALYNLYSHGY